jgi:hypothetical protein
MKCLVSERRRAMIGKQLLILLASIAAALSVANLGGGGGP